MLEDQRELMLYKPILGWLENYLVAKHPHGKITVADVHATNLSVFLEKSGLKQYFPEYSTYTIRVDLVGAVEMSGRCLLTLVEVKTSKLSLINLSQLIGYCKTVQPEFAFLISPDGMSSPLSKLLNTFKRLDVLEYKPGAAIKVAQWSRTRQSILMDSVIPHNRL